MSTAVAIGIMLFAGAFYAGCLLSGLMVVCRVQDAFDNGRSIGIDEGKRLGETLGYAEGYDRGHHDGVTDAIQTEGRARRA